MLYCSSCQMLTEGDCPVCGKRAKKLRAPHENDPVFLFYGNFVPSEMIEGILADANIPFSKIGNLGAALAMKTGTILEQFRFFVPYGALNDAVRLIEGALGDNAEIMSGLNRVGVSEDMISDENAVKNQYSSAEALEIRQKLHSRFTISEIPFYDWVLNCLDLRENLHMLDIGCGAASIWTHHPLPNGMKITLADKSEGMLDRARENVSKIANAEFNFALADAASLPFPDDSFDLVFAGHMLYHVRDIDSAINEFRRVLKPEGRLCATTLSLANMKQLYEVCENVGITLPNVNGRFSMENGGAQLGSHFLNVDLKKHISTLQVTEVQPLMDYVKSLSDFARMDENQLAKLEKLFTKAIDRNGSFDIDKIACMFIARGELI